MVRGQKGSRNLFTSGKTRTKMKSVKHDDNEDNKDNSILNLLRMTADELITYVQSQLGESWEMEMGFSPGLVKDMLSGEGAAQFKTLLLSNLFPENKKEEQICMEISPQTSTTIKSETESPSHGQDCKSISKPSSFTPSRFNFRQRESQSIDVKPTIKKEKEDLKVEANGGNDDDDDQPFQPSEEEEDEEDEDNSETEYESDTLEKTGGKTKTVKKSKEKKENAYSCDISSCSLPFRSREELIQHQFSVHGFRSMSSRKKCLLCDIIFEAQQEQEIHEESHVDVKPFKCSYCWRRFNRNDVLKKHELYHKTPDLCCTYPKCNYKCSTSFALKEHFRKLHMKLVNNPVTGSLDGKMDGFVLVKPGEKPPPPLKNKKQVQKKKKCPVSGCSKRYITATLTRQQALQKHLENEHPDYLPFTCKFDACDKKFALEYLYNLHLIRGHSSFGRRTQEFCCTYEGCDRTYKCQRSLTAHLRTHVGEFPYQCTHEGCGKKFTRERSHRQHLRTHEKIKPYLCPVENCGHRNASWTGLQNHLGSKHDQKPYKCTYCDYRAVFAYVIQMHTRAKHTGERPYKCPKPNCTAAYASHESRRYHIRTHNRKTAKSKKKSKKVRWHKQNDQNTKKRKSNRSLSKKARKKGMEISCPASSDEMDSESGLDLESDSEGTERQENESVNTISKSDKSYQCPHGHCTMTFNQGSALRQHMKISHGPLPQPVISTVTIRTRTTRRGRKPLRPSSKEIPSSSSSSSVVKIEHSSEISTSTTRRIKHEPTDFNGETEFKDPLFEATEPFVLKQDTEDMKRGQIKQESEWPS